VGFLTTDAVVNPGYARSTSASGTQVNPAFNTWGATSSGGQGNRSWLPCRYAFSFYGPIGVAQKLKDEGRGAAIYFNFPNTTTGRLGELSGNGSPNGPTGNWYCNNTGIANVPITAATLGSTIGVMKGPDMGQPLMLAAESYFLQAEAAMKGLPGISGSDATLFDQGVTASFSYLYKLSNGSYPAFPTGSTGHNFTNPVADVAQYKLDNPTSYLVNYTLATTQAQKLEAIITQKYIAVNMIHSYEVWNEYRRTGYPVSTGNNEVTSMATNPTLSSSSRPDRMPTRIQYPATEFSLNPLNVPKDISTVRDLIFWAQ
jgi:hypothetical protein